MICFAILLQSKPLADCNLDDELFLQAQNEIELYLEQNLYEKFLKSDKFSQYAAQCESMSPKASSNVPSAAVQQSNLQVCKQLKHNLTKAALKNLQCLKPQSCSLGMFVNPSNTLPGESVLSNFGLLF